MSKVVVIGAGPAGLYAAISLRQAGVTEVVVCDKRLNTYTREGHLDIKAFKHAIYELDIRDHLSLQTRDAYHIKEFERMLYQEAQHYNITFIKQHFVAFLSSQPGVIVEDAQHQQEDIPCSYVLDCTGSSRIVVNAMNNHLGQAVFISKPITDPLIKSHLIAYVKLNPAEIQQFISAEQLDEALYSKGSDEILAQYERLRSFGWPHFILPRCYGAPFGKGKMCLYLQMPDNLAPAYYQDWLAFVLNLYTQKQVAFSVVKPSQKNGDLPRLLGFRVNPHELSPMAYQANGLPMVIALGDAQIDANYALAHGIFDGMKRIDRLMDVLTIKEGAISSFDEAKYNQSINAQLTLHRTDIEQLELSIIDAERTALAYMQMTLKNPLNKPLKNEAIDRVNHLLDVIESRLEVADMTPNMTDKVAIFANLSILEKAYQKSETDVAFGREKIEQLILATLLTIQNLGNQATNAQQFQLAADLYLKALLGYEQSQLVDMDDENVLRLVTNLIIVKRNMKQFENAFQFGLGYLQALGTECQHPLVSKIIHNMLLARQLYVTPEALLSDEMISLLIAPYLSSLAPVTLSLLTTQSTMKGAGNLAARIGVFGESTVKNEEQSQERTKELVI